MYVHMQNMKDTEETFQVSPEWRCCNGEAATIDLAGCLDRLQVMMPHQDILVPKSCLSTELHVNSHKHPAD